MRPRVPAPFLLAVLSPTLVVGLLLVVDALDGPGFPFAPFPTLALWLLVTLPAVLVAWGARGLTGGGSDAPVHAALEAVSRAEKLLAQEAEKLERSEPRSASPPREARRIVAPLLAILVLAGALGVGVLYAGQAALVAPNPIHVHATFALFADGERIAFTDPSFDLASRGFLRGHLHAPNQDVVHVEGPPGLTFGEFLRSSLGLTLQRGSVFLDEAVHGGRLLPANETHAWRLLVAHDGGDAWTEIPDAAGYVPRDRDRILFALATPDDPLEAEKAAVGRTVPVA